ncbi:MAG: S8 family peptidase [Bacteroidota bacterium]
MSTSNGLPTVKDLPQANLPWSIRALNIPSAWSDTIGRYDGKAVKVAILDTGIDTKHPDLLHAFPQGNDWYKDFTDSGTIADQHGHGTQIAGILAALPNKEGVAGVAPGIHLYVAKVVTGNNSHSIQIGTDEQLAEAVRWAVDQEVDIINLSVWSSAPLPKTETEIRRAYRKNIFVVACAGNHYQVKDSIEYPARYNEVISVGSVGKDMEVSEFSSRGAQVDIVAPGEEILTTDMAGAYDTVSGTSFAAPFVAGVMALIIAKHKSKDSASNTPIFTNTPKATFMNMKDHLVRYATDIEEVGKDDLSGHGLINVQASLEADGARNSRNFFTLLGLNFVKFFRRLMPRNQYTGSATAPSVGGIRNLANVIVSEIEGKKNTHQIDITILPSDGCKVERMEDQGVPEGTDERIIELYLTHDASPIAKQYEFNWVVGPNEPGARKLAIGETCVKVLSVPADGLFTIGPDGGSGSGYGGGGSGSGSGGTGGDGD